MTLVEWIGFLVSMLALIFLTMGPKRSRQPEPTLTKEQARARRMQERHLRKVLGLSEEVEEEAEEEEVREVRQRYVPVRRVPSSEKPRPKPVQQAVPHIKVEKSRGYGLIKRQRTLKDAVLLREILGPPKGEGM